MQSHCYAQVALETQKRILATHASLTREIFLLCYSSKTSTFGWSVLSQGGFYPLFGPTAHPVRTSIRLSNNKQGGQIHFFTQRVGTPTSIPTSRIQRLVKTPKSLNKILKIKLTQHFYHTTFFFLALVYFHIFLSTYLYFNWFKVISLWSMWWMINIYDLFTGCILWINYASILNLVILNKLLD
jgi:hypothetical protein